MKSRKKVSPFKINHALKLNESEQVKKTDRDDPSNQVLCWTQEE
jgi:hypothetical protein